MRDRAKMFYDPVERRGDQAGDMALRPPVSSFRGRAPSRSVTHRPYPPSRFDANTRWWRPSADQRGFSLFPPVTAGLAPVPSARQVHTSKPPPTRLTNAMRSPLGDHAGESV